ncbi:hypothetical protein [Burkholderia diffusa]|uniref:hypothetical protein n=1 Tax=Burkholderia diffusa TaxID=488732 RepID=UPI00075D68C9|nr:hypothetical protein [Burkholderia diffusa]KVH51164.1 hypothetical protein WJ39_08385 [Burkholderia diffusa]
MDWSDLANNVGKAAPLLGALLNGPARASAGALIAAMFDTDATPQAVAAELADDPETHDKLLALQALIQALPPSPMTNGPSPAFPPTDPTTPPAHTPHSTHEWVRPAIIFVLLAGALGIVAAILSGVSGELLKNSTASLTVGALIAYWFAEVKGALAFYFGESKAPSEIGDETETH